MIKYIKPFFILCLLTIAVRLPWLFMIPLAEAPDENSHLWVINFLSDHLRLPTSGEVRTAGAVGVYGSIPQIGYLGHVLSLKGCFFLPKLVGARLGSLFMGLVAVISAYCIGQEVFATSMLMIWALPLLVIFHPQFVFVNAYTNNDASACALTSLILLILVKTIKHGFSFKDAFLLGLLAGGLLLSKYSAYAIIPIILPFLAVAEALNHGNRRQFVLKFAAFALTAMFLSLWWFIRNYGQFAGDIFGSKTLYLTWATSFHRPLHSEQSPLIIIFQNRWWRMNFFSFWGWFGYMTKSLPRYIYYGYLFFVILAIGSGFNYLFRNWPNLAWAKKNFFEGKGILEKKLLSIKLMFLCLVLVNLLISLAATSSGVAGPQGRYLFPSEIAIMALILEGLNNLPRAKRVAMGSLLFFNLSAYLYSSFYLFSLYGGKNILDLM